MYVLHVLIQRNANQGLGCCDSVVLFAGVGVACADPESFVRGVQI